MNYKHIYNQLMERALARENIKNIYMETHHVLPKCMGGLNARENLVKLTAREHFLAHWLLVRLHPDNSKLIYAFWMMCYANDKHQDRYKPSSRVYAELREAYSKIARQPRPAFSGSNHPLYGKRGIYSPRYGRKHSQKTKDLISQKRKGFIASSETNSQISRSLSYGNCYKAKSVTCHNTGRKFSCAKELAEFLGLSYTSVRRWLNWATPITFRYSYDQQ